MAELGELRCNGRSLSGPQTRPLFQVCCSWTREPEDELLISIYKKSLNFF